MEKDIIIFNLLIGWEIIHFSKVRKKLSFRLRDFPDKHVVVISKFLTMMTNSSKISEKFFTKRLVLPGSGTLNPHVGLIQNSSLS
jgi:hypothetical protein